jgi:formate hydrogenlyase subunit 4
MSGPAWIETALALLLAPLLPGIIARVKALFAGRQGQPLLQAYFDIIKLLRKGTVYSETTTWVFRAGPIVGLSTTVAALSLLPVGGRPALVHFAGDFVLLAYLLALGRYFTVAAALDTGSSFEGMGASREVHFAALAEPTLLLGLAALARQTGGSSLSSIVAATSPLSPEVLLVGVALSIVLLSENARIPFDDPNTHLELTMVHEVMVLDHGGPDLGLVLYASSLKLWLWTSLLADLLLPATVKGATAWSIPIAMAGVALLAIAIGVVESTLARLRLVRVPQLLATAAALAAVALILVAR